MTLCIIYLMQAVCVDIQAEDLFFSASAIDLQFDQKSHSIYSIILASMTNDTENA